MSEAANPVVTGVDASADRLDDAFDMTKTVGFLLRTCQQVHVALWSEEFAGQLTSPQFAVLHALASDGPLTQTILGSTVRLDRSTTADVVARLVARGLVAQVKHPVDARLRIVRVTAKGKALHRAAIPIVARINDAMLVGLTERARGELVTLLSAVLDQRRWAPGTGVS